jgi:hypothetical protein
MVRVRGSIGVKLERGAGKFFRSTNVMVVGMLCSGIGLFDFQLRSENSKVACSKSAVLMETCDFEKLQFLEG